MVTMWRCWFWFMWFSIAAIGRGLAAPGDAGDQDEPGGVLGELPQHRRQSKTLEGGDGERNHPHDDHERGPLPQNVDPEPPDARHAPGAVVVLETVDAIAVLVRSHQLERDRPGLLRREALLGERHQLAVDARAKEVTRLDVQVGGTALDRGLDDSFDRGTGHQVAPKKPMRRLVSDNVPGRDCSRPLRSPLEERIHRRRIRLQRFGAGPDRSEGRDHRIGQTPLAVQASPAAVRHFKSTSAIVSAEENSL